MEETSISINGTMISKWSIEKKRVPDGCLAHAFLGMIDSFTAQKAAHSRDSG